MPDLNAVATWLALVFSLSAMAGAVVAYVTATKVTPPARVAQIVREGREVIGEAADTLEKMNTMALRFAKRDRDKAKAIMEAESNATSQAEGAGAPMPPEISASPTPSQNRAAWKAQLRERNGFNQRREA